MIAGKNKRMTITAIIMAIIAAFLLTGAAYAAAKPKVYDHAGILTPDEKDILGAEAEKAASRIGADVIILTVSDNQGLSPELYCDIFYEGEGFSENGLMLYIDMGGRDVYMATYGNIVHMFSVTGLSRVLDSIAPSLSNGDYYNACSLFISMGTTHIEQYGGAEEGMSPVTAAFFSLIISILVPLVLLMLHSRSLAAKASLQTYFSGRGFRLVKSEDRFIGTNTTRVPIPRGNNNRGGGSGGARITPGGRMAGGAGRKF